MQEIASILIMICLGVVSVFWFIAKIFFHMIRGVFKIVVSANVPGYELTEVETIQCRRNGCGVHNPAEARFCRRCGRLLRDWGP